ncbi:division plane positioning ATPase MipZ [Sphingomicrobium aestuariivivum]|uniref:division plane positioning ATPase MipZ n=1 Tax=Sphingomicrobium aestuariivivum TaxID=1582356 RepID=UPI001FD63F77|nr:division plane positioning ATPase MipZ [Sphingomicrobium aestuariivivum]MCJ8191455.1 division plane positioning ATPase MipZ [Sphingomicrobium aestuariivivum]
MGQPHFIVFANEKGGTGKSTTAVHTAIALAAAGARVGALDLDQRQRTLDRYLENREKTAARLDAAIPMVQHEVLTDRSDAAFDAALTRLATKNDFVVVDTPGRDDEMARTAILFADTLVTPINDSFVDLDLIGQVDPETYEVARPSFYADLIWQSRQRRAKELGRSVDWVILRNRLQHIESHNKTRVTAALSQLSKRVGFRTIPGLGERVIFRELFPKGLTLLDFKHLPDVGLGHIAARQELREMVASLDLPDPSAETIAAAS